MDDYDWSTDSEVNDLNTDTENETIMEEEKEEISITN